VKNETVLFWVPGYLVGVHRRELRQRVFKRGFLRGGRVCALRAQGEL
jgi:hypothetical protein